MSGHMGKIVDTYFRIDKMTTQAVAGQQSKAPVEIQRIAAPPATRSTGATFLLIWLTVKSKLLLFKHWNLPGLTFWTLIHETNRQQARKRPSLDSPGRPLCFMRLRASRFRRGSCRAIFTER
jgi:hypothetical protein